MEFTDYGGADEAAVARDKDFGGSIYWHFCCGHLLRPKSMLVADVVGLSTAPQTRLKGVFPSVCDLRF